MLCLLSFADCLFGTERQQSERAGYHGQCEVEILSANNWWKRDPDEVLRICIERHQTVV